MEQATIEQIEEICSVIAQSPLNKPNSIKDYDKNHVKFVEAMLYCNVPLDKVEVKISSIHGRGIFSKRKIQKGELITIYPAHYISVHPDGRENPGIDGYLGNCYGDKKGKKITETIKDSYAFDVGKYYAIYGHPDITHDSAFLGHMINDGARGHSTRTAHNKKDEMIYYKVSVKLANAMFVETRGLSVPVVAIKEINVGEEILVTYGYGYWNKID